MSWENPPVPHEVNVSRESVLAEFVRLCAGLALCVGIGAVVLHLAGGWLARRVPYRIEQRLVGASVIGADMLGRRGWREGSPEREAERYLQALADSMTPAETPHVVVHLTSSDVPNAFATLGGHVVVARGLYRRMPSENALATVLAHEIGHIVHRDPIGAIGGGAAVATLLAFVGGDAGDLSTPAAAIVQLGYSRRAETEADGFALAALRRRYGHAGGAAEMFEVLAREHRASPSIPVPDLLSTHPADRTRIDRMRAAEAGPGASTRRPLKVVLR